MDGGGTQFELPATDHDDFYLFDNTVDYWKLKYQGGHFLTCQIIPFIEGGNNYSTTMSWENKAHGVEEMSFTGWIFRDSVNSKSPTTVEFDSLMKKANINARWEKYLSLKVDHSVFERGSLVIVNRRVSDVPYSHSLLGGSAGELDLNFFNPVAVRLRDRFGNLHERKISHWPESIVGHRNHLMHGLFDSGKVLRAEHTKAKDNEGDES
ncbi:hypothetical protein D3C79_725620 [compost metagenome]